MKKNAIIEMLEQTDVLMRKETTFAEYTDDLLKFQNLIVPIVMGDDYSPGMRLEEAIFRMESKARERGLGGDPVVRKGINSLKTVNKEIHICMAGRKGEDLVAKTLEYVDRPEARVYRNVYLTDGREETELDMVVLTDSGVIILEIKKSKDDLTITEEGRLIHSSDACYEKRSLGTKMGIKRKLLKERLSLECARRGFEMPVEVDSYIVFVTPKGVRIHVDDKYHCEKWCFRTSLNYKIAAYANDSHYRGEQLEALADIMGTIEQNRKSFTVDIDYEVIRESFAEAMDILTNQKDMKEKRWEEIIVDSAKDFNNSKAGRILKAAAPMIIAEAVGPAAGLIGKMAPKAAPYAARVASSIKIVASRVPVA